MEINICINGSTKEVKEIIDTLQAAKFKEIDEALISLQTKVGSLDKAYRVTDAALCKLQTGKLKLVDLAVR